VRQSKKQLGFTAIAVAGELEAVVCELPLH
jgi:hypothetical protein